MENYLRDGLRSIGFSTERVEPLAKKLEQYVEELYMFNKAYDLCGADTKQEIIIKHVLDSICAAPHIEKLAHEMQIEKNKAPNKEAVKQGQSTINLQKVRIICLRWVQLHSTKETCLEDD